MVLSMNLLLEDYHLVCCNTAWFAEKQTLQGNISPSSGSKSRTSKKLEEADAKLMPS
jgi:hypothetical protein